MKKFFTLIIAGVLMFSLFACKSENVYGNFINDTTYENQFVGIGFSLPESWDFYTDEELNKLYQQSVGAMPDRNEGYVSSVRSFYDMGAHSSDSSGTVIVHLSRSTVPVTDKEWNEASQTMVESYKYMGYSDIECERIKVNISDTEFDAIKTKGNYLGSEFYPAYFLQIYFAQGDYAASVSIGTVGDDKTEELLEKFYLL